MDALDFNGAEPQRAGYGALIPDDTICLLVATLRPGTHGPGGWLKASNDGGCLMADFEFTVDGGDFDRRKLWGSFITEGTTDGHAKAANITRSRLRAMLESANGVNPSDDSAGAVAKRQVAGWQGFDGLRFCARVGIEQGGLKNKSAGPDSERYADKNVIKAVITPDEEDYVSPGPQAARTTGGAPSNAGAAPKAPVASKKPAWAS